MTSIAKMALREAVEFGMRGLIETVSNVCMFGCVCVCVFMYACVCVCVCRYACVLVFMYVCMCVCTHVCMSECM